MVVNLDTPAQIAELMYVLAWFVGTEATVRSDHAAGDLWRGNRQREADYKSTKISSWVGAGQLNQ